MSIQQPSLPTMAAPPEAPTVAELLWKEVQETNNGSWDLTTIKGRDNEARDYVYKLLHAAQAQQPDIFTRYYHSPECMDALKRRLETYATGEAKAHTEACRAFWATVERLIREAT